MGGITVFAAPGGPEGPKAAFVAGRTVGPAVQRNRAKRRLREALGQVPIREDRDYVVIATAEVARVPFGTIVGWLTRAVAEER